MLAMLSFRARSSMRPSQALEISKVGQCFATKVHREQVRPPCERESCAGAVIRLSRSSEQMTRPMSLWESTSAYCASVRTLPALYLVYFFVSSCVGTMLLLCCRQQCTQYLSPKYHCSLAWCPVTKSEECNNARIGLPNGFHTRRFQEPWGVKWTRVHTTVSQFVHRGFGWLLPQSTESTFVEYITRYEIPQNMGELRYLHSTDDGLAFVYTWKFNLHCLHIHQRVSNFLVL